MVLFVVWVQLVVLVVCVYLVWFLLFGCALRVLFSRCCLIVLICVYSCVFYDLWCGLVLRYCCGLFDGAACPCLFFAGFAAS